ncbi:negative transcriptional regulator, PaiB family [Solimonas aquatica]|uniref:Negative transcriptional regulator, PaiB family n=1 Tax=Solimonas aquatica TaxID=489703 RepID=A0A1H9GKB9_9GAMM|nr:FMN-binding negative transcriptional regulator [Solimonas aquatica]SEQ50545.1 negative transcriptional regulator, PaiB family [Solimonas aquatica]
MSLYTPESFHSRDRAAAEQLIADYPFATLITSVADQAPCISHLPLLREGELLYGHMARANPHWQQFAAGRTLAVFQGPHAYVSPRWYPVPQKHVPTWNYAVVHVGGQPELLDEEASEAAVMQLSLHFDPQFMAAPARLAQLLPGIVAFRLPMTQLEIKFKMSQNRTPPERAALQAQLLASREPLARATGQWMKDHG